MLDRLAEFRPGQTGAKADGRSLEELARALLAEREETSGFSLALCLLEQFKAADDAEKRRFFAFLNDDLDIDAGALAAALESYRKAPGKAEWRALMEQSEPPRQELVRRINRAPGATVRLVRMREELIRLAKADESLARADLDFRHLFASWFNRGFLLLTPVNWNSPACILERIIEYEAVHEIKSWDDLRRRLAPADRRCFAYFHPAMPGEPLIFVEIALTRGVPGSVDDLLAEERCPTSAGEADTAVFYSISNCQPGLRGISFGNLLIKQVVNDLAAELPQLKTFITLSPIPGFTRWLEASAPGAADDDMTALAADYLLNARRGDDAPLDPVARFHLANGARAQALHEGADRSERGQRQSRGVMVNYLYDLNRIPENQAAFAAGGPLPASKAMRSLAEAGAKLREKRKTNG